MFVHSDRDVLIDMYYLIWKSSINSIIQRGIASIIFSNLYFYREGVLTLRDFVGEVENDDALDDDPNVKIKYKSSEYYL